MQKKMNVFLSSDCMWYMHGCCWLKVVVVIAKIKMPGGGCVPLIPYLISRSRGEALNPEHTHTLTLLQTHILATKKHTCNFTDKNWFDPRTMFTSLNLKKGKLLHLKGMAILYTYEKLNFTYCCKLLLEEIHSLTGSHMKSSHVEICKYIIITFCIHVMQIFGVLQLCLSRLCCFFINDI